MNIIYYLIEFLDELVFGVGEVALPLIRDDLTLTYTQIGLLLSLPGIIAAFIEPFIGILGDVGLAMTIADQLDSGKVHINEQTVSDEANSPFGGMKNSGNGSRIGGHHANMESFTEIQWLTVRPDIAPYPF